LKAWIDLKEARRSTSGYQPIPSSSFGPREIFDAIDGNGDGLISVGEFRKAFQGKRKDTLIPMLTRVGVEWNEVFKVMDRDGSGAIDFPEFQQHIQNVKAYSSTMTDRDPAVTRVFNTIDMDQNGLISKGEFQKAFTGKRKPELIAMMSNVGVGWKEVFQLMDKDSSGEIDLSEFQAHVDNVRAFSSNVSLNNTDLLLY